MQYAQLGRTGLKVSRLCLGTFNFNYVIGENEATSIMDRAVDLGINLFDTANIYGDHGAGEGSVEEQIGNWMQDRPGMRDRVVLATKVYGRMGPGPNDRGLSAYHIRRACEDSLKRLKTDHIDLYQMHHIDRACPWDEVWQAMEHLVKSGKVIYVGSSNFAAWHIALAQKEAEARGFLGLVSEQSRYNLDVRTVELEVLPAVKTLGIGFLAWSPLAGGLLSGPIEDGQQGRRTQKSKRETIQKKRAQLDCYEELCREVGETPSNVALAWLLSNPAVTAPVIGPRTIAQLDELQRSLEIQLPLPVLTRLDEIWRGPGVAPEAYALW